MNNIKQTGVEHVSVKRTRLSEQIAEQIQHIIIQGHLQAGNRLPPERDLAEQLGVSRTVVREATKVLEERGLVKIVTGSGTYATRVQPSVVSQSIGLLVQGNKHSFRDLLEIRKMLEVEIAGLATERSTAEDIHQLETNLGLMVAVLPEINRSDTALEEFVQADILFHRFLAKASKNILLPILLEPITDLLLEFSRKASMLPGAPERAVQYHRIILEQVRGKDAAKSREAMRNHISNTEELLELMGENGDDLQD